MYYLVKGVGIVISDEDTSFEWIIDAESKEAALAEVNDEWDEMVDILEVREISVEERIEREEREFLDNIKTEYLIRNYGNRPVREYKKYQEQMQTDKEMYYNALVESNKILYRKKRLLRYIDKKKITIDQYEKVLMALCKAKTEEDLNAILANALNSIIQHN